MATFAPETPVQPEYPYFWQKPTQEPKPNQAGLLKGEAIGKGLSEAGSAIREGAQGITAAYEKGIQNAIYAGVDPLRDEYMERLHQADQEVQGRETPDPLGRDAPRDVKQLPHSLDTLDSAKENGKLSQTDYDARLTALAKEIRAKYPGFRQYVDEEFKRVTGRDSANQYIRSVIGDIDSFIAKKNNTKDKFESLLFQHAYNFKDGDAVVQAYLKDPEKMRGPAGAWLNDRLAHDHYMATVEAENKAIDGANKVAEEDKVRGFHENAGQSSGSFWSPTRNWFMISSGMTGDINQQRALQALEEHDQATLAKYPKEQLAGLASNLNLWGEAKKVERAQELRKIAPSSITDKQIEDQVNAEFNSRLKPFIDALSKPDLGLAANLNRLLEGAEADSWAAVQKEDPQLAAAIKMYQGARKSDPELYKAMTQTTEFQNLANRYQTLIAKHQAAIASPPGSPTAMTSGQVLQEQDRKKVDDGRVQRLTVDFMKLAGNKEINPQTRQAIFENSFAEDSGDILKYFAKESYTGPPFRRYLGQQWVFDQLTDPKMITEGEKFGKENGKSYDNYRKWAETSVNYLVEDWAKLGTSESRDRYAPMGTGGAGRGDLRRPTPSTLADIMEKTLTGKVSNPNITVTYNDTNHEFTFIHDGKTTNRQDLISLGRNMSRLAEVVKHDPNNPGHDPTKDLYEMLKMHNAEEGSILFKMERAMLHSRGE